MNPEHNYNRETDAGIYASTQPQENPVDDTEELPAVAKLREAFDTARNALIDGSELAKQVQKISLDCDALAREVCALQRDLEYVRNRNRELDEQVTLVRQARDEAIIDAAGQRQRADQAEGQVAALVRDNEDFSRRLSAAYDRVDQAKKDRDDAEYKAMELEEKLKVAEAKLAKVEAILMPTKPAEQPRTETGQFQSYDQGSQGSF